LKFFFDVVESGLIAVGLSELFVVGFELKLIDLGFEVVEIQLIIYYFLQYYFWFGFE
jgi:hypothetical protein